MSDTYTVRKSAILDKTVASPCYHCEKRYVSCHGDCKDYKNFKIKLSEYHKLKKKKEMRFHRRQYDIDR